MARFLAGCIAALLLVAAGVIWWQGRAPQQQALVAAAPMPVDVPDLPPAGDANAMGEAPPLPPSATPRTREERRFDRYDRNRDNILTRNEMLGLRVRDFKELDTDGNNLLSFEEWSVRTASRFDGADANHDGKLTRTEFATTAPTPKPAAKCKC
jgi:hypothetical protein